MMNSSKWTFLERIDHSQRVNRWYAVGVQATLFDQVAVVRFWGSRANKSQRVLVRAFDNETQAREIADRLIRAKVKRKYRIVAGYNPDGPNEEPESGDEWPRCF
jgi:predicted DNA-binding WGR domain protein